MTSAIGPTGLSLPHEAAHPVDVRLDPVTVDRNRLTAAFRPILAIPHLVLVGGPAAVAFSVVARDGSDPRIDWGASSGAFGAVAGAIAIIAWFSIIFTGQYPAGLRSIVLMYLRWRVRAVSYLMLLRDEYPPFGEGEYPAQLVLDESPAERDRVSVGFRIFLVLPHLIAVTFLNVAWAVTTLIAWFSILFRGTFPMQLYHFGHGVMRWTTRVEAYLLLLHDDFPPFSFS